VLSGCVCNCCARKAAPRSTAGSSACLLLLMVGAPRCLGVSQPSAPSLLLAATMFPGLQRCEVCSGVCKVPSARKHLTFQESCQWIPCRRCPALHLSSSALPLAPEVPAGNPDPVPALDCSSSNRCCWVYALFSKASVLACPLVAPC
jgi:hypothetical protein